MPLCSQICGTSPPHLGTEWHPDPSMGGGGGVALRPILESAQAFLIGSGGLVVADIFAPAVWR